MMSITPATFQENAAQAVVNAFKKGSKRYLVADETGLGKTIIARRTIELLAGKNETFVVYYFGSNLMLLDNTVNKLRKDTDWEYHAETKKMGMMAGEQRPVDCKIHIYGFSANLLGESSSTGDDLSERPCYEILLKYNKKRFSDYAESLHVQNKINDVEYKKFVALSSKEILTGKNRQDITVLRKIFELYTLENNPPNLIIFDEFHRYDQKVTEFIELSRKIKLPNILFLSATPYNYYPGIEAKYRSVAENEGESAENKTGREHRISNFKKLLRILEPNLLENGTYDAYCSGKVEAEVFSKLLKEKCLYRNERLTDGTQKYLTLPTAEEFATLFSDCFEEEKFLRNNSNSRYWKLCSGVYSFPIQVYNESNPQFYQVFSTPGKSTYCEEDMFVFDKMHKLKRTGVCWENLRFACIKHYNAENGRGLLWVPPSMPEYKLSGKFENNSFTKLMIFSAYKMVPRIVSGVFSAYVADDIEVKNPVDLSCIDNEMKLLWGNELFELTACYAECIEVGCSSEELLKLLVSKIKNLKSYLSQDKLILTAKYIIGSPYMCAARVFEDKESAEEIAEAFNMYFQKEGIKQAVAYCKISDAIGLLDYCIDGGLGAVMKEYRFSGGGVNEFKAALKYGTYIDKNVQKCGENLNRKGSYEESDACSKVHVYSSDCYNVIGGKPFAVPCHYAERFNADYSDTGASETSRVAEMHFKNCHNAFISPFWPMILCTTAANQEGYDLDRYCCRIMHYSLPPNTMAFEQRDGRIDRRLSLLARRRMAQLYSSEILDWDDMFKKDKDRSGMSPCWTQEQYLKHCDELGLNPLKFERIVPYFPMTAEYSLYRKLMEQKNEYRGHFGLPNESECGIDKSKMSLKLNDI